jgi:hypothetical protein
MADSSGQTADFTEEAEAHPSGPNDCETAIVCSSKCATSKTNVRVVAQDNGFIPPLSEKGPLSRHV